MRKRHLSVAILLFSQIAIAEMRDCSSALIMSNVSRTNISAENLALASSLSRESYQQAQRQVDTEAVIYGVPMGADYSDFQSNIQKYQEAFSLQDVKRYYSSYVTSSLDPTSLEAYKACLSANNGLAVYVKSIGSPSSLSYVIGAKYDPMLNQKTNVSGSIIDAINVLGTNLTKITNDWVSQSFSGSVDREFVLVPIDPSKGASIVFSVGAITRSIYLPPLNTRKILTGITVSNPGHAIVGYQTGFWGSSYNDLCYTPSHKGGSFITKTSHFVVTNIIRTGSATVTVDTPQQICYRLTVANTSDVNSSVLDGHIEAREVWLDDASGG